MALLKSPGGNGLLGGPNGHPTSDVRCCVCDGEPPSCCEDNVTRGAFFEDDENEACTCLRGQGDIELQATDNPYIPECPAYTGVNETPDISDSLDDELCPSRVLDFLLTCSQVGTTKTWRLELWDPAPEGSGDADPIGWFYDDTAIQDADGCIRFDGVEVQESPDDWGCGGATKTYTFVFATEESDCWDANGPLSSQTDQLSAMIMGSQFPPEPITFEPPTPRAPLAEQVRAVRTRLVRKAQPVRKPRPARKIRQRMPDVGNWLRKLLSKTSIKPKRGFGCQCNFRLLDGFTGDWYALEGKRAFIISQLTNQAERLKIDADNATIGRVARIIEKRARHVDRAKRLSS